MLDLPALHWGLKPEGWKSRVERRLELTSTIYIEGPLRMVEFLPDRGMRGCLATALHTAQTRPMRWWWSMLAGADTHRSLRLFVVSREGSGVGILNINQMPVLFRIRIFGVSDPDFWIIFWIRSRIEYQFCSSRIRSRIIQNAAPGTLFVFLRFDFFLQKLFDNLRLERSDAGWWVYVVV